MEDLNNMVQAAYEVVMPVVDRRDVWLFDKSELERLTDTYENNTIWIGNLSRMYKNECERAGICTEKKGRRKEIRTGT